MSIKPADVYTDSKLIDVLGLLIKEARRNSKSDDAGYNLFREWMGTAQKYGIILDGETRAESIIRRYQKRPTEITY